MRESRMFVSLAAVGLTAFTLVSVIFLAPYDAFAGGAAASAAEVAQSPSCSCPGTSNRSQRPKFADFQSAPPDDGQALDSGDEMAALSSVQHALSATADGATYVWHRNNGRLSGLVQPTSSFKNVDGDICRHIVIMLTTGEKTLKTEGVACRKTNGVWTLEG